MSDTDVAARIAAQTLARRGTDYTSEVRRLLDAALEVIRRNGTTARARVADIVAEAGLSNDAFYRHFPSKDALVAALLQDGTERLAGYLDHQMAKAAAPEERLRRWVEGVFAQTKEESAATALAVLWNGTRFDEGIAAGRHNASGPIAALLHDVLVDLGSTRPAMDASLVAHAAIGKVAEHLWAGTRPGRGDVDHLVAFVLGGVAHAGASR